MLVYLIKGIPLGHGVREAFSTVGICGAKVLAFRQQQLDLNSYSILNLQIMTLGQKEMSEVLFPNKNRNVVYQKRELHANSRTFALNSIAKANKVWVVQIFVTQAFKR